MSKPTPDELEMALSEAKYMREHGKDPHFMAKSLLNMNYRIAYLEKIFHLAERYLLFGMEEEERLALLKAIEQARHAESRTEKKEEDRPFGLG